MKFVDNIPIYIQIMNYIKRKIITEELNRGDKLPSVRELAESIKVNPNTVQRAYQELEREDVAYSQRGLGRYITEDEAKIKLLRSEMADEIIKTFIDGICKLGYSPEEVFDILKKRLEKGCTDNGDNS
ncbi:DNA-binding transcriptional regulator YhcF, GntR family [Clostridium acidisoli DSM 12555]|jgi:DNA-binding transcriptional regulator YhcF (GntR family)|uniref:DNA-binding transcriptional regulator YhcF, GntR family n=1 Tax=Clostridium acidisoli DSM 12555 TaxID=1121291 RepID=A0A1W1XWN7_9CLOT|nr:GntR family transcriptional regulator [Clostridium acidisoli]SMC28353.1 DNA-binding transcriptional regulator YhcF, GntR family [Clostridium acidisoli DSM 12555]